MPKILTPISHLFNDPDVAEKITALSDGLESRDHSIHYREDKQLALHCELQPIHALSDTDFEYLEKVRKTKPNLELVTFHVASCYNNPIIVDAKFRAGGQLFSRKEMIDTAAYNFSRIKKIFGENILLAVENNNYYATEAYVNVTDPDFISEIVYDNDIHFLLDIAHARISAHNTGISYDAYLNGLPMDKAIQLHICRYDIKNNEAYDAHFYPDQEEWIEIERLLHKYPIEYLTVEYYRDEENLLASLKQLRLIS